MAFDPAYDLVGALVWRENWIEDMFDPPAPNDQCYALHEPHSVHLECWQPEGIA